MSDARRLIAATKVVSGITACSRVLGMVRDVICAAAFGAGPVWDAFAVAFQIPNLFRRLFGEGALSAAMIPVFSRSYHSDGPDAARRLAGAVTGALLLILAVLVIGGEAIIAAVLRWGDHTDKGRLALELTAVMLPYAPLVCLVAILGGMLNVLRRFAAPAAAPIVLNLVLIATAAGAVWAAGLEPRAAIFVVAGAVVAAGVLQVGLQVVSLRGAGFGFRPRLDLASPPLRRIGRTMLPITVGASAMQLSVLADSLIALWVADAGGPSALYYASRLYQLPLALFGIAMATVIFAQFSEYAAAGDRRRLGALFGYGIRMAVFLGLPAGVALLVLARPIVALLFERGEFTPTNTVKVAGALRCYAAGIWAYSLQHIIVRLYYALDDARTPARTGVAMVGLNVGLSLLLVGPMDVAGIALATAICAALQIAYLGWRVTRRLEGVAWGHVTTGIVRTAAASAILGGACWAAMRLTRGLPASTGWQAARVVGFVVIGCVVYAAAARSMRMDELRHILGRGGPREPMP